MSKALKNDLNKLIEQKLVRKKTYDENSSFYGLEVYKYQNRVFFDNLWHKSKLLLKARGLVLDENDNIVVHPFDKVFNYQENNTGRDLKPNDTLQIIEKVNGFLGCISLHKNKLLFSTTGSLDSDFVTYIKDFITSDLEKVLINYLQKNNYTLMFEVIHPKDPHIITYKEDEMGLYLIGARGKNIEDNALPEKDLDLIAKLLNFKRPKVIVCTRKELEEKLKSENIEGFMVRNQNTNDFIMKAKTDYYLTTKFIGRMGKGQIDLMYKNKELFKKDKIEEEFYSLVDILVENTPKEQYEKMTKEEKVILVKEYLKLLEKKFLEKNKNKVKIN